MYMQQGYYERTHQVLFNGARMDPTGFKNNYFGASNSFACTTAVLAPLRYDPNLQQAAVQQSTFLSDPSCPFQHNTCSKYCYLYGGACDPFSRIIKYQPDWKAMGENLALVTVAQDSMNPLLLASIQ